MKLEIDAQSGTKLKCIRIFCGASSEPHLSSTPKWHVPFTGEQTCVVYYTLLMEGHEFTHASNITKKIDTY